MTISPRAQIGEGCEIAPTARIGDNVILGAGSRVEDFCIIGYGAHGPLEIGPGAVIRSHSVVYGGSSYGPGLRVGHHCMVREAIRAGVSLQLGSYNDLEGDAEFGDYVRCHSQVHVSKGTRVGDFVWLFPNVVTTNDPAPPSGLCVGTRIGAGAIVATSSVLLPGCELGLGAFVGALTRVGGQIPACAVVVGNPGQVIGSVRKIGYKPTGIRHPWTAHFRSYYPEEAQGRLDDLHVAMEAACAELEARKAP
jgi:acetyltransferase-like isoleucine patch superfamily enzyme